MYREGETYEVEECIIDLSGCSLDEIDEATAVIWGAAASFKRCVIRGAGKIALCGSGNAEKIPVETGKRVKFIDCILENGSRRFPEVHDGMQVLMHGCLVRNWGAADRFNYDRSHPDRNFGAWAHTKGSRIDAVGCVFWQDKFWRPIRQMVLDYARQIEQAWNDEKWRGLLRLSTWMPGQCKGLLATAGGEAYAWACWRNHWWIAMPWGYTTEMMDDDEAKMMISELEQMAEALDAELPKEEGR